MIQVVISNDIQVPFDNHIEDYVLLHLSSKKLEKKNQHVFSKALSDLLGISGSQVKVINYAITLFKHMSDLFYIRQITYSIYRKSEILF